MMIYEPCQAGNWGFPGNFGLWGWIGLIFNLVFWVGLIAGLILFVIWAKRGVRGPAAIGPFGTGPSNSGGQNKTVRQQTAKEILQAQYARGEITREQYEVRKQDVVTSKASESMKGESK